MFVSKNLSVNESGHLTIGSIDTIDLVSKFGTPLYVMDEALIRENCKRFKASMDENYDGNGLVCYASKAFCCKEMCRIVFQEGLGIDVVSGGELFTAIAAGFPTEKICFHGNNKTDDELMFSIRYGVGRIIVDNLDEMDKINVMAKTHHKKVRILIRVTPGVDAHTHDFVKTGKIDCKFGFPIETGAAYQAVEHAMKCENLELSGMHCHIGSQIFDVEPFTHTAEVMIDFIAKVKNELGFITEDLNLGGGFGVMYTPEDNPIPYETYMQEVSKVIKELCKERDVKLPFILIEPGRSIVASAGITLYKVGSVKEIPGYRTYVSVDGGMCDNPRYILYKSKYDFLIANKAGEEKNFEATVAGKCCESGDLLGENVMIQKPEVNDIMAVCATGAYNYSMASNYNRISKPAVVMVNGEKIKIAVKRESIEDVIQNDV